MALMPTVLQPGVRLAIWTGTATTLYSCPGGTTALVKRASFCNTTSGIVGLTIFVTRSGAPSVPVFLIDGWNIAANATYNSTELNGLVLTAGDVLKAQCSVDQAFMAVVSGFTI